MVTEEIKRAQEDFYRKFDGLLRDLIQPANDDKGMAVESYYATNCVDPIKKRMGINFVVSRDVVSSLYMSTVEILFDQQIRLLRFIRQNITNDEEMTLRELLTELEYYRDHIEHLSPYDMKDPFSGMLYRLFNAVTVSGQVVLEETLFQSYYGGQMEEGLSEFYNSVEGFAKTAITVMSECFADCKSANILGLELPNFLLAFVYETWDIDKALPLNIQNVLRMGVDLKILFGISGKLSKKQKRKINELKDSYAKAGFELKVDLGNYLIRVDEILSEYEQMDQVGEEIIKYLEVCGITSQEPAVSVDNEFWELYGKFRNPVKVKSNMYIFLDYWRKLAGDIREEATGEKETYV